MTKPQRKKIEEWVNEPVSGQKAVHYTRLVPPGYKKRRLIRVLGNEQDGWYVMVKGKKHSISTEVNTGKVTLFKAKGGVDFLTSNIKVGQTAPNVAQGDNFKKAGQLFEEGEKSIVVVKLKNNSYRRVLSEDPPSGKKGVATYQGKVYYYNTAKRKVNITNKLKKKQLTLQTVERIYQGNPVVTIDGANYMMQRNEVGLIPFVRTPYIQWNFKTYE